jgi:transcriptional regulator with XRE-family HTH domain
MFFGQYLKQLRLKYRKVGLHDFAFLAMVKPSDLNAIENGYMEPPKNIAGWIDHVMYHLGIENTPEGEALCKLYKAPFEMQLKPEHIAIAQIISDDGEEVSLNKIKKLQKEMKKAAKDHNAKVKKKH